jgi:predicted enzyme related to lactoylglutathione lyase
MGQHTQEEMHMPGSPIVHFEFHGRDRGKLEKFYSTLFGWNVEAQDNMEYGLIRETGSGGIGGGIGKRDEGPMVVIYMQVPDPMATIKQAEGMGGKMLMPPMEVPGGPTIAMFADPEGNPVGLVKGE